MPRSWASFANTSVSRKRRLVRHRLETAEPLTLLAIPAYFLKSVEGTALRPSYV